ncbi:MAG: alanine--tRNA ligase [Thermodesulfobacteriota bacterium]
MTGNEIREKFLSYFKDKGHSVVESSSLVPADDPTLLFTNAGMVQFKGVFTGEESRGYSRATTSQRCVRAGGKHNDLDNVGYTARHHTFFEMLGNFSFGDYFKKEAIAYGWEFLIKELGLDAEKMWVSVFEEDDEAFKLWEAVEDLPEGRIVRLGEKDNFWAMGDTGPCGPCSEIHYDQGAECGCDDPNCAVGCDCDRWLEVWNLVFMQFERSADGTMAPLPKPSIDTGMGLERITSVVQGVKTNYDTDLFQTLIAKIAEVAQTSYGADKKSDVALKVIADHARATTFLVSDGVLPSNEGRGYVLRRIMRRAVRYGRTMGLTRPFLGAICQQVVADMAQAYPHIKDAVELIAKVVENEEKRFLETLDHGLALLGTETSRMKREGEKQVGGAFIFKLYDTYGFPSDIVRDIAIEQGLTIDEAGFNEAMAKQRDQSRQSWKGAEGQGRGGGLQELQAQGLRTTFCGYDGLDGKSAIVAIIGEDGELCQEAKEGQVVGVVCDSSPFYGESGGQCGDRGLLRSAGGVLVIQDTTRAGEIIIHHGRISEGGLRTGDEAALIVDSGRRQEVASHHSATHLLQAALRQVLGDHVKQSGSLVEPDRLRFDFTNFSALSPEEISEVEKIVNGQVRRNIPVVADILTKDEAMAAGATALFGEKYGDEVRVVSMSDFSKELCGGTHVASSGEIGLVKIVAESGVAAGVRRIEALCGSAAFARFQGDEEILSALAEQLKGSPAELPDKLEKMLSRQKQLEKEISQLNAKLSLSSLDSILENFQEVNGVKVISATITLDSAKTMREIGDKVRDKMGSGIAVLGGVLGEKVSLLALVSKDLIKEGYKAGDIIKKVAGIVGGGGGGRPDMAQAGGTMPDKLDEALAAVAGIVENAGK